MILSVLGATRALPVSTGALALLMVEGVRSVPTIGGWTLAMPLLAIGVLRPDPALQLVLGETVIAASGLVAAPVVPSDEAEIYWLEM